MTTRAQEIHEIVEREVLQAVETGMYVPTILFIGPNDLKALLDEVRQTFNIDPPPDFPEEGAVGYYLAPTGHKLTMYVTPTIDEEGLAFGTIIPGIGLN